MGRNRILSCAFALVLAFGPMPTTAFAAPGDVGATLEARDNDSLSNATTINVGATVTGALVDGGDNDFYRFSLSSAGVVTLTFGTEFVDESRGWRVYLRDQNGEYYDYWNVYRSHVGDFTTPQIGLPAGTYYVQVAPYGTTTATYHLRVNFEQRGDWETEYNDNRSDADAISVNSLYYGSTIDGGDNDFYRFSLSSAGVVTLTFGTEFVDESRGGESTCATRTGSTTTTGTSTAATWATSPRRRSACRRAPTTSRWRRTAPRPRPTTSG